MALKGYRMENLSVGYGSRAVVSGITVKVLPEKMKYNLSYISNFGFRRDIRLMFSTLKHMVS